MRNEGPVPGSEIAQFYLEVPQTNNFKDGYRSPKVLKGFKKTKVLLPGHTEKITFELDKRAFSYWDVTTSKWHVEMGRYGIYIGTSSRHIRLIDSIII